MITKIPAVEYNLFNSIMQLLRDRVPDAIKQYNILHDIGEIPVLPAYPRDLTRLRKPSIIVRKVDSEHSKCSLDGFIGQYYDKPDNALIDVKGMRYDYQYQFDVIGDSNTQCIVLESIITEDVVDDIIFNDAGVFPIYDFTVGKDVEKPEIGSCTLTSPSRSIKLSSWRISVTEPTSNNDYVALIRQPMSLIQTIVPRHEFVDLSKWIKIKQTIKLQIKEDESNG